MTKSNRILKQWACGACAFAFAVSITAPAHAATNDPWITTKVKVALLTAEDVSGTNIDVDTINHNVTLHGKVNSADEKARAEKIARDIKGVEGVRNLLQIVSLKNESKVQKVDDELVNDVSRALQGNKSIQDSTITVQSVNGGVVLLSGNATTMSDQLTAIRVAKNVPGVKRVSSEIQSSDTVSDSGVWGDTKDTVAKAADDAGNATTDVYITSMTKMRLLADRRTPGLDINVDTEDGVVTLFGMVPDTEAKQAAEANAREVAGVKNVENELQIVSNAKKPATQAKDDEIERNLRKSFSERADLKGIQINVENCTARLSGTVPTNMDRLEAAMVARANEGVCSVKDDLRTQQ